MAQALLIALIASAFTVLTTVLEFRSGWNAVWMLALPFGLGFFFNRDAQRGAFMAMTLSLVALFVETLIGGLLGY